MDLALHLPTKQREYSAVGAFHPNVRSFVRFLFDHTWLADASLIVEYYSQKLICNTPEAQTQFVPPDKKPLPSVLSFNVQKQAAQHTGIISESESES